MGYLKKKRFIQLEKEIINENETIYGEIKKKAIVYKTKYVLKDIMEIVNSFDT